jgi:hypothetical protein
MSDRPRLVVIESRYAGDIERNVAYARAAVRDSIMRGESPVAFHLLHTQPGILRDEIPEERARGIAAGLSWTRCADLVAVYTDLGISTGMQKGIEAANAAGIPIEYRQIVGAQI